MTLVTLSWQEWSPGRCHPTRNDPCNLALRLRTDGWRGCEVCVCVCVLEGVTYPCYFESCISEVCWESWVFPWEDHCDCSHSSVCFHDFTAVKDPVLMTFIYYKTCLSSVAFQWSSLQFHCGTQYREFIMFCCNYQIHLGKLQCLQTSRRDY